VLADDQYDVAGEAPISRPRTADEGGCGERGEDEKGG
jgi:hypothetical protein